MVKTINHDEVIEIIATSLETIEPENLVQLFNSIFEDKKIVYLEDGFYEIECDTEV